MTPLCLISLLFAVPAAFAGAPPELKEAWRAVGASSETVLVSDASGTSLLSLVNTGVTRSLVRVDAVTGRVQWQTDVVPGIGWGGFSVLGDDVHIQGVPMSGDGGTVAAVSLSTGERRWTRSVPASARLEFGRNGGRFLTGDCAITVLGHAGADLVRLPGVRESGDSGPFCGATPQLLGEVRGRAIVLVPQEKSRWRLNALAEDGTGWTVDLGVLHAPPEVDWRTGLFWLRTADGLVFSRYNLWTGQVAWRSLTNHGACHATVRAVDGPLGAPAVLVQACAALTLLDPHDGKAMWEAAATGEAVMDGEHFCLPEWIQPGESPHSLQWLGSNGKPLGTAVVPAQTFAVPVSGGVIQRGVDSVSFMRRDGTVAWSLPMANPRWALLGDLLILAPELGSTRLVVRWATGSVLGRFEGGEALGTVTVPGSEVARLLFVQGEVLTAFRVKVR